MPALRLILDAISISISAGRMKDGPGPPCLLSALSVSHSKLGLCGGFVWARRAFNRQKRRFSVPAGK
jgi:hypothetical protein